jgi:DNA invertase Pin-like site-specific DNA recombinase
MSPNCCSQICSSQRKAQKAALSSIKITCGHCHKVFIARKTTTKRHFCSNKCRNDARIIVNQKIVEDLKETTLSTTEIALKYNVSTSTVLKLARINNVQKGRQPRLDQDRYFEIVDYYTQGNSLCKTAKKFHSTIYSIKKILKACKTSERLSRSNKQIGIHLNELKQGIISDIVKEYVYTDISKQKLQKKYSLSLNARKTLTKNLQKRKSYRGDYEYILCPSHPRASKTGRVAKHILEVEKAQGRFLNSGEVVHHKNFNKKDNRLGNLVVMLNSPHSRCHGHIQKSTLLEPLVNMEVLQLDEVEYKYFVDDEWQTWYQEKGQQEFATWKECLRLN